MARKPRVKMLSRGVEELMTGREVTRDIRSRTDRMASSAGPGFAANVSTRGDRARGYVRATNWAAYRAEHNDHALTRSLDAAR